MSLTPLPNALGVVRPTEVIAVGRFAQPPSLTGQFAGLPTSRFAAVMLVTLVAVIREEKIAATAALTSLGTHTHRGSKRPRPRRKEKSNARRKEGPGTKKEETFCREDRKKIQSEEYTISNRRF